MRENRKRVISGLVLVSVIGTSVPTLNASEWFEGYQTGASPQKWTDGGGGKYYYGGNFTYRFKRQTTFKPLLEISPPGIKAGCNGISISGGFLHMLGLDDIKEQLQSASQGAMMGVVVGIVYSLPGIADAFDKVQKYVRMLQQILSQSCQMTASMTKSYIDEQRKLADNKTEGDENVIGTVFAGLHAVDGLWDDTMKKGDDYLKEKIEGLTTTADSAKKGPAINAEKSCGQTCQLASKNEGGNIKTYVQANAVGGAVFAETTISNLSEIMKNDENRRSLEFSIVFLGYYANNTIPKEQTKEEFAKAMVQTIKAGGVAKDKTEFERGLFYSGNNIEGASIVNILMNGNTDGKIKMPNIKIYPYYTSSDDGAGKTTEEIYGVLFGKKDTGSAALSGYEYEWKGLEKEGYSYLKKVIVDKDNTATPTIPAALPGFNRYVQVLKIKHQKGNEVYVDSMMRLLARKNAGMLLNAIVYEMESIMEQTGAKEKEQYKQSIIAVKEKLKNIHDEDGGVSDLVEIFEREEQRHGREITGGMMGNK